MATRQVMIGGYNAQAGNPFSGGGPTQTTAMMPMPQQPSFYPVTLGNGQRIFVKDEADYLKLKEWHEKELGAEGGTASLGRALGGSSGAVPAGTLLETGATALEAVSGFLAGRRYATLLQDMEEDRASLANAISTLQASPSASGGEMRVVIQALVSMRDYIDDMHDVVSTQITAMDMQAGGATARGIAQFMKGSLGGGGGNGLSTTLAVGAAGVGAGLLLSNNSTRRRSGR